MPKACTGRLTVTLPSSHQVKTSDLVKAAYAHEFSLEVPLLATVFMIRGVTSDY